MRFRGFEGRFTDNVQRAFLAAKEGNCVAAAGALEDARDSLIGTSDTSVRIKEIHELSDAAVQISHKCPMDITRYTEYWLRQEPRAKHTVVIGYTKKSHRTHEQTKAAEDFASAVKRALNDAKHTDCVFAKAALDEALDLMPELAEGDQRAAQRKYFDISEQVAAKCPKVVYPSARETDWLEAEGNPEDIFAVPEGESGWEAARQIWDIEKRGKASKSGRPALPASQSERSEWRAWQKHIARRKKALREGGLTPDEAERAVAQEVFAPMLDPFYPWYSMPEGTVIGQEDPSAWVQGQAIDWLRFIDAPEAHKKTVRAKEAAKRAEREEAKEKRRIIEEVYAQHGAVAPWESPHYPRLSRKQEKLLKCIQDTTNNIMRYKRSWEQYPMGVDDLNDAILRAEAYCKKSGKKMSKCVKKFYKVYKSHGKSEQEARMLAEAECGTNPKMSGYGQRKRRSMAASTKHHRCLKATLKKLRKKGMSHRKAFGKASKMCSSGGGKHKKRR